VSVSGPIASTTPYQPTGDQTYPTPAISPSEPTPFPQDQNVPEVEIEVKPLDSWDSEDSGEAIDDTTVVTPTPTQKPKPSPTTGIDVEIKPYQEGDF